VPVPTPFHPRTSELCTSLRYKDWAGYYAVCSYDTYPEREYFALRNAAGLIDVTPLYKFEVHGPDAAEFLSRLMDRILAARNARATIVCATSGDTGGAAVEAFRGAHNVDIVVLFPEGRVSDVQRRMMTTPDEANVHALSIRGTFDDCQALVIIATPYRIDIARDIKMCRTCFNTRRSGNRMICIAFHCQMFRSIIMKNLISIEKVYNIKVRNLV